MSAAKKTTVKKAKTARKSSVSRRRGKIKQSKPIKASEFDRKFDDGEDVIDYLDLKTAKMNYPIQRVSLDVPKNILEQVDAEAARIGVTRTSLIKIWIADRLSSI